MIAGGKNDIHTGFNEFSNNFRNQINVRSIFMPIDNEVFAFDETHPPNFSEHRDKKGGLSA